MTEFTEKDFTEKLVTCQVMMPHQANVAGNVHGGEVMKMMDNAAGALAIKYARGNAVTARVDEMQFHLPILVGDLVTCTAYLVYTGKSSMEIFVEVVSEDLESNSPPQKALSAFFTMVALGKNGRPVAVRPYEPTTEIEKEFYNEIKAKKNK